MDKTFSIHMSGRERKSTIVMDVFQIIKKRKNQTIQQKTGQKTEFNFIEHTKCPVTI